MTEAEENNSFSALLGRFSLDDAKLMNVINQRDRTALLADLAERFPRLRAEEWEEIFPSTQSIIFIPCRHGLELIALQSTKADVLFMRHQDVTLPHLRVLHRYPHMLPRHQVDIGGCKFVLSGANVMCQGLTSAGGRLEDDVDEDTIVAIFIEGKKNAVSVGRAIMSTDDIRDVNKGPCVENLHHMGDGVWVNFLIVQSQIGNKKERQAEREAIKKERQEAIAEERVEREKARVAAALARANAPRGKRGGGSAGPKKP
jgi:PUA domain protein